MKLEMHELHYDFIGPMLLVVLSVRCSHGSDSEKLSYYKF